MVLAVAGWLKRRQHLTIAYLQAENAVLREQLQLGGRKPSFTDSQRCRLARAAKKLGRAALRQIDTLVTPKTLLRWHRRLIAEKWTFARKGDSPKRNPGRPVTAEEIEKLILRLAKENPAWGYRRIAGELKKLGCAISHQTVANLLRENGIDPAPKRGKQLNWREFFRRHADTLWATDFFTCEVWTSAGLTTFYVLFYIHVKSRKIVFGGITESPDEVWMKNRAKALTWDGAELEEPGVLIHDRDSKYSAGWASVFEGVGWKMVKLPPRSPNLNAFAERFVRSIKEECLNQLILVGEKSLHRAVTQYIEHFQSERPHQGIGNVVPFPDSPVDEEAEPPPEREIVKHSRLGGLLNSYRRAA